MDLGISMEYMALMASNLSLKVLATFTDFQKGLNKAKFCLKLTTCILYCMPIAFEHINWVSFIGGFLICLSDLGENLTGYIFCFKN